MGAGLPSGVLSIRAAQATFQDPTGLVAAAVEAVERCGRVAVVGAPAMGRTRLVNEIMTAVHDDVTRVELGQSPTPAIVRRHATPMGSTRRVIAVPVAGTSCVKAAVQLWRSSGVPAIAMQPLARDSIVAIAEEVLDVRGLPATLRPLIDLAGGRPGDLVELLLGCCETGALRPGSAGWTFDGPISVDRVHSDVVQRRSRWDSRRREAFDTVAVAGQIPMAIAATLVDVAAVTRLYHDGVLVLQRTDGHVCVAVDRPAEAGIIARLASAAWRTALLRRLRDLTDEYDAERPGRRFRDRLDVWDALVDWQRTDAPPAVIAGGQEGAGDSEGSRPRVEEIVGGAAMAVRHLSWESADVALLARQDDDSEVGKMVASAIDAARAILSLYAGPVNLVNKRLGARRQQCAAEGDVVGAFLWTDVAASVAEASGQRWAARDTLAALEMAAEVAGLGGVLGDVVARRAVIAAESGRFIRAADEIERAQSLARDDARCIARLVMADALVQAVADVERSSARAIRAADSAFVAGHLDVAVNAAMVPIRSDLASPATPAILQATGKVGDLAILDAYVAHAGAQEGGSVDELVAVGRTYIDLGRRLLAAETMAAAARRAGPAQRGVLRALATGLLASCPGAWTVGVADLDPSSFDLDDIDRHIGSGVVMRASNAQIADFLTMSPRTVEARLTGLFRCLGVTSRRELRQIHGPLFEAARRRGEMR
ncbi:MAG: hypothetical protein WD007_01295 [Nitriliruptoraceae bacterium]